MSLGAELTMPLEDLQGGPQQAQAHVLLRGILVQRLQGHQQHVLRRAPITLFALAASIVLC